MRVDDTCCMFGSIFSDHCPALNAPVAFTLTTKLLLKRIPSHIGDHREEKQTDTQK